MRAGFFIDGFNMYGAIEQHVRSEYELGNSPPHHLKWLSYRSLCTWMASTPHQTKAMLNSIKPLEVSEVSFIHFYTALQDEFQVSGGYGESRRDRHATYVEACRAEGVKVILGSFKYRTEICPNCGAERRRAEEKETDVRIAIDIVEAAHKGDIDVAFVLTSDSDISPAVQRVRELCNLQIVSVAFEPRRHSKEILSFAQFKRTVNIDHLRKNLMGAEVHSPNGAIPRPSKYRPPAGKS